MINFYKDRQKKTSPPTFFRMLRVNGRPHQQSGAGKANKTTQLRKFYDEVVRFNGLAKATKRLGQHSPVREYAHCQGYLCVGAQSGDQGFVDFIKSASTRCRC